MHAKGVVPVMMLSILLVRQGQNSAITPADSGSPAALDAELLLSAIKSLSPSTYIAGKMTAFGLVRVPASTDVLDIGLTRLPFDYRV